MLEAQRARIYPPGRCSTPRYSRLRAAAAPARPKATSRTAICSRCSAEGGQARPLR